MVTDPRPPTTPERLLCRHLAGALHRSQVCELLVMAGQSSARSGVPEDAWNAFARDLLGSSPGRQHRVGHTAALIADALNDPSVRDRTKAFLRSTAAADPVDALQDAELLVWLMRERLEEVLDTLPGPPLPDQPSGG